MIELSKCPNCAPEDRVTIAGKEFCMRCGTPAEDNAMMGAADSQDQAHQVPQASGVSKFSSAAQPEAEVTAVNQDEPQIQHIAATQPIATNTAQQPELDAQASANNQLDANTDMQAKSNIDAQINSLSMSQAPTANTAEYVQATNQPKAESNRPVRQFVPPPAPIRKNTVGNATAEPIPQSPVQPKIAMAIDQSAMQEPEVKTQPEVANSAPSSNVRPIHDKMTLDKSPGVLSDDQFNLLQNSVSTPSELVKPHDVSSQPSLDNAQPQPINAALPATTPTTPKASLDNDIYKAEASKIAASEDKTSATPETTKVAARPDKKKKSLKPAGIAVSVVALFLVGAYVWRLNYSSLAFKVASAKAGMTAVMPGYVPAGFNLAGDIKTNPGAVSYSLNNSSSNKNITISQAKTDWDSQALAENYVAPKSENYLALQAQGLTLYVFGNNQQATWVNKGTWYRLESSDKALTQDQIIKIATSL